MGGSWSCRFRSGGGNPEVRGYASHQTDRLNQILTELGLI